MAWNPSPKVAIARDFAKKFGKKQIIILAIDKNGVLEYASYGETKKLCDNAKRVADIAFDAIMKFYEVDYDRI